MCFEESTLGRRLFRIIMYLPLIDFLKFWKTLAWLPFERCLLCLQSFTSLDKQAIFSSNSSKPVCYLIGCFQRATVHLTVISRTPGFTTHITGNCFRKQTLFSNRAHGQNLWDSIKQEKKISKHWDIPGFTEILNIIFL